jgi:hypothetical protein
MTQTFMRFLHCHRTEEYMEYLYSTDVEQQRASTAYLSVTETEFFALDSEDGRRNAVCNLLGLVKFWAGEDGTTEVEGVEGMEGSHEEVESGSAFDDADGDDTDGDDTDGDDADGDDADGDDADGDDSDGGDADYMENDGWDSEEDSDIDVDNSSDDEDYDPKPRKRKRCSS